MEANGEASRGTTPKARRKPSAASGWTTTKVAGKALGVSPRTVQSYLRRGLLDGRAEGEGVKRTWYVSVDSINALRAERLAESDGEDFRDGSPDVLAESIGEAMQNLSARLAEEAAKAARLETRLELTEKAQSTLREERERLLQDLARERERADRAERRAEGLEARLIPSLEAPDAPEPASEDVRGVEEQAPVAAPQKGVQRRSWWRRLFG